MLYPLAERALLGFAAFAAFGAGAQTADAPLAPARHRLRNEISYSRPFTREALLVSVHSIWFP